MTCIILPIAPDSRPFDGDEVLAYYDGPLIFWLPSQVARLLAIALPDEAGPHPFLVVEVSPGTEGAMLANKITMQKVVRIAPKAWVMRDYSRARSLLLEPLTTIPDAWLPGDYPLHLKAPK